LAASQQPVAALEFHMVAACTTSLLSTVALLTVLVVHGFSMVAVAVLVQVEQVRTHQVTKLVEQVELGSLYGGVFTQAAAAAAVAAKARQHLAAAAVVRVEAI
jgi:hypothetical protein